MPSKRLLPSPAELVAAVYLSRKLGADGHGLFTVAATFVPWVRYSISSMMSGTTIKYVSEREDWGPVGTTALRTYLVLGLAGGDLPAVGGGPSPRHRRPHWTRRSARPGDRGRVGDGRALARRP